MIEYRQGDIMDYDVGGRVLWGYRHPTLGFLQSLTSPNPPIIPYKRTGELFTKHEIYLPLLPTLDDLIELRLYIKEHNIESIVFEKGIMDVVHANIDYIQVMSLIKLLLTIEPTPLKKIVFLVSFKACYDKMVTQKV